MKRYLQKLDTLGLLLLVAAAIWYSVTNVWERWNLGLAIAGGALVIVGIAANYRQILASLGKRSTKYAGNYVVSLILVIAVVSGLNYLGQRHPKRFDMTSSGQYTLAQQTVQVVEKLKQDVDIKAFFPGGEYAPLKQLLIEYRTISAKVRYEFIDPDKHPEIAKQYDVTVYGTVQNPLTRSELKVGTVVISYGNRRERIEKRNEEVQEQDLTNALIKIGRSESKKVYFVQGHGEKDIANTDRAGYSEAKKALENQGYQVGTVTLVAEGKVPADAKVLVIAGPTTTPFEQETKLIEGFLNRGGSVFLMLDIPPAPSFDPLLKSWGIAADKDVVLDSMERVVGLGRSAVLVLDYEAHKITERLEKIPTFFLLTRSIRPEQSVPSGVTVEPLYKSDSQSWGETDLSGNASRGPNDIPGPLPLAVAATRKIEGASANDAARNARMVVTGTSFFPINAFFATQGNGNLFLNMVNWLAQDEDLISIRPKQTEDRRIILSQSQLALIRLATLFVIPGVALIVGIVVIWNRRRK